ncbi:LysR substrate-binding domain-containing protein [Micromonospora sp. NPDC006431]|uniref:LysR substrate-binding domain-containing protein n=1 Tax=Micromonospora sp. NPDC006431 TaxID=3364235 RepID=UPI00369E5799
MEPDPPRRRPIDGSGTGCDGHPEAQQRPALTALRHQHPDAELSIVEITSERGIHLVEAGDLDVAVISSYQTDLTPPPTVRAHRLPVAD